MKGIKIIAVVILVFAVYSLCSPIDMQGLYRSLSVLFCSISYTDILRERSVKEARLERGKCMFASSSRTN